MTRSWQAALVVALLVATGPAQAQMGMPEGRPFGPPIFLTRVFLPKLVMEHQQEIGLRPAQVDAIKQAMADTQHQMVDLQWKLDAESEALDKLLAADHADETAVLAKLDHVLAIEQQVKKTNFTLLVRIKNLLDAEQQTKLRTLRPAESFGRHGPPPPSSDR